jgi:5-methylcytosine-specific restriction endonuclease McrA
MRRQHGRCPCGAPATVVHHIGPADDDTLANLVALCYPCHTAAHGRKP